MNKIVMYSGDATPRFLHAPKSDEDHIWLRPDGSYMKWNGSEWIEFDPRAE